MRKKLGILAALAMLSCGLQACFVEVDNQHCERRYSCDYVCNSYVITDCGFYSCWDEIIEDCGEVCSWYDECYYVDSDTCRHDRDCGHNQYCSNGSCYNKGGYGQHCDPCNKSGDCADINGACVALNSGEQVCLSGCQSSADCPINYECQGVADHNLSRSVCVPNNESCDNSYCRSDMDCVENASCINNRCELDMTNLNECDSHADCSGYGDYYVCVKSADEANNPVNYCSMVCYSDSGCEAGYTCQLSVPNDLESGVCYRDNEHACVYSSDCEGGMVCQNGHCMKSCSSNADCASPSNGFSCVAGVCKFYM